jgi:DNA-binding NarL/FixJ family response regulator
MIARAPDEISCALNDLLVPNGQTMPTLPLSTPIRVMIVDPHPVFRHGLTAYIESRDDLQLAGQAANGIEALHLCEKEEPDVILIDVVLPEQYSIAAIRAIHAEFPKIHIIALTDSAQGRAVRGAFLAGATGYLLKTTALDELARAIHTAHTGEPVLSSDVSQLLIKAFTQRAVPERPLTPREREVLALMVVGNNNVKIAAQLGVGRETIKSHVSNILAKLGVKSRVDAVILALQQELPLD